jgi:hypothetical protein
MEFTKSDKPFLAFVPLTVDIWQGVAVDSLKFHSGLTCFTLKHPVAVPGVAHPQGRRRAARFDPFGHPTLYAYASTTHNQTPTPSPCSLAATITLTFMVLRLIFKLSQASKRIPCAWERTQTHPIGMETHANACKRIPCARKCTQTHANPSFVHANAHKRTLTLANARKRMQTYVNARKRTQMPANTCKRTQSHANACRLT